MCNPVLDAHNKLTVLQVRKEAFTNVAKALKMYYELLRKQGFSRSESLQITIGYQVCLNNLANKT